MSSKNTTELPACYAMVQPGLEEIAADEIAQALGGKVKRSGNGFIVFRLNEIERDILHHGSGLVPLAQALRAQPAHCA